MGLRIDLQNLFQTLKSFLPTDGITTEVHIEQNDVRTERSHEVFDAIGSSSTLNLLSIRFEHRLRANNTSSLSSTINIFPSCSMLYYELIYFPLKDKIYQLYNSSCTSCTSRHAPVVQLVVYRLYISYILSYHVMMLK